MKIRQTHEKYIICYLSNSVNYNYNVIRVYNIHNII